MKKNITQEERLDYLVEEFKADSDEYKELRTPDNVSEKKQILRSLMNIRMPKSISDDVLAVQDDYLKKNSQEKGIVCLSDITVIKDGLSIWQGDITRLAVDAIVNAANSQMLGCFIPMHTCIDNCIHTYAGIQLRAECNEKMNQLRLKYGRDYEQPTAVPMLTDAYNLPAKKVVHIVGPIVNNMLTPDLENDLADCYRNTLNMCAENDLKSVAFCCISTGVFHFPNKRAAEIAVQTVTEWMGEHPSMMERVIFNVFKDEDKEYYEQQFRIEKLKEELRTADAVVVGAGSGLSTSAGFTYSGDRFNRYFYDFAERFGIQDIYSGGFYPFPDEEIRWAWWARHIYFNRYIDAPKPVYKKLLELVKDKDYFVITTNVDHQFQKAGFDKKRLFYTQGDYGLFQTVDGRNGKTYDNEEWVMKAMEAQGFVRNADGVFQAPENGKLSMRIPTELIPKSSDDDPEVTMNLRADDTFVEDEGWHRASAAYFDFLQEHDGQHILFLELGVGANTPVIVKYPFWQMTMANENAVYACINHGEAFCPGEIEDRSICIDRDIGEVIENIGR